MGLCGKQCGNRKNIFIFPCVILQSFAAAKHPNPYAPFVALEVYQFDQTDFTGFVYMGAAAGTYIIFGNGYNPDIPGQLFFAAVI